MEVRWGAVGLRAVVLDAVDDQEWAAQVGEAQVVVGDRLVRAHEPNVAAYVVDERARCGDLPEEKHYVAVGGESCMDGRAVGAPKWHVPRAERSGRTHVQRCRRRHLCGGRGLLPVQALESL